MTVKRNSMAAALSQAAGHAYSRAILPPEPAEESKSARIDTMHAVATPSSPTTALPPSRVGKKPITGFFDPSVSRQIKKLGLENDCTMQDLLQEAFNDLFRKYDLPPIA